MPCDQLMYNTPRSFYVVLAINNSANDNEDISQLLGNFSSVTLKYLVKDCDPNTNLVLDDEGYINITVLLTISY